MGGVGLGGRESDLTIPECGLAIMQHVSSVQTNSTSIYNYINVRRSV